MTREFKGTPGPWECTADIEYSDTYIVRPSPTFGESYRNAKLIEAAPELLKAALDFVEKVDDGRARSTDSYNKFKQAINKALGND